MNTNIDPMDETATEAGYEAFDRGKAYDPANGDEWCLGWVRAQSAHAARVARRSDGICGFTDCPHCDSYGDNE